LFSKEIILFEPFQEKTLLLAFQENILKWIPVPISNFSTHIVRWL